MRADGGRAGLRARAAGVGGGEAEERGEDDEGEQHCLHHAQPRPRAQVLDAEGVDREDALHEYTHSK